VEQALGAIRMKAREMAVYALAKATKESEDVIAFAKKHKNPMSYFKAFQHRAQLSGLLIERHEVVTVDLLGALIEARRPVEARSQAVWIELKPASETASPAQRKPNLFVDQAAFDD
jgi:hypothetical protein